jgi:hypothetical protein
MDININLLDIQLREEKKKNINNNKNTLKMCSYNFFSVNEIEICEIIKEIPYYQKNFNIIEKCDFMKIGKINEKFIEPFNLSDDINKKYVLIQFSDEKLINFKDFIFIPKTPKCFIFYVLESYIHVLSSLIKLNSNNICFFNLSSENISFKENLNPIFYNFKKSLQMNKLDYSYISKIVPFIDNFTCKPLELYVIFYLIINNIDSLSYSYIEVIVDYFINNSQVFELSLKEYTISYKETSINYLKKYINIPKIDIINDLLKNSDTWDNYSLSIIYLHVVYISIRCFSLNNGLLNNFLQILIKNVSPEPSQRLSLNETLQKFNDLFNLHQNLEVINKIKKDKMKLLYQYL